MALLLMLACAGNDSFDFFDTGTPVACDSRTVLWQDADGDGYGNAAVLYIGCESPSGYVANADDCDDTDPARTTTCDDTGA